LQLVVADTGPGVEPDELPHLFDRFWRGRAATGTPGSGAGLTVVAGLVRAHGGRINVASTPGTGTDGQRFAAVLCHGVLMYLARPEPLLAAVCRCAAPDGVVSLMTLNARTLAVRPALERRWADALAAFDATDEVGVLGADTRGLPQRRRVVDTVAGHGGHRAARLQGPHEPQLVLRGDAGEHIRHACPLPQLVVELAAISAPVIGGACPSMPSSRPIAAAVVAWSPVIILTAMPAS
jgi:hypothetical protein